LYARALRHAALAIAADSVGSLLALAPTDVRDMFLCDALAWSRPDNDVLAYFARNAIIIDLIRSRRGAEEVDNRLAFLSEDSDVCPCQKLANASPKQSAANKEACADGVAPSPASDAFPRQLPRLRRSRPGAAPLQLMWYPPRDELQAYAKKELLVRKHCPKHCVIIRAI
jgi:hypothetical protein